MAKILLLKPSNNFEDTPESIMVFLDGLKESMQSIPFTIEMNSYMRKIFFTCRVDAQYVDILEGQLYSTWPDMEVQTVDEFLPDFQGGYAKAHLTLEQGDLFPLKRWDEFKSLPLVNHLSFLNKLGTNEGIFYQLHITPYKYKGALERFTRDLYVKGKKLRNSTRIIKRMFDYKFKQEHLQEAYKHATEKNGEPLYQVHMTILSYGANQIIAKSRLQNFCKSFLSYENNQNAIAYKVSTCTLEDFEQYKHLIPKKTCRMSASEIASLFHFPRESDQIPNVMKVLSRKAEPPIDLPTTNNTVPNELCVFATTNFRDMKDTFGITYNDRERHMYVIGKSGSGKSKMLESLIADDIRKGKGVGVMDPHGDLIDNIIRIIPQDRVKDVVLFDASDSQFPISFNPLEKVEPAFRVQVASGFIEIFKKLFGANWTLRLEHVLRFVVLALLDTEDATPMSVLKMLTDREFRQSVIPQIQDSVVKNFWTNEFASWSEKFDSEAIMPILNKIGQFLSNTQVRNIVCQKSNRFNMKQFMDEGKIVLIKLSKGLIGEENSELIGSMIITKMQQAAMQRANMPEEERLPFYFYVDEFQNFATDTFANILSEARKYKLSLTVSHQYMAQLTPTIKSTIFGNVGTLISFRVGPEDAMELAKEFEPVFTSRDIVNLGVREIYLKLSVRGEVKNAFSAKTLLVPPPGNENYISQIVEQSRTAYCKTKEQVENEMAGKEDTTIEFIRQLQSEAFEAPLL